MYHLNRVRVNENKQLQAIFKTDIIVIMDAKKNNVQNKKKHEPVNRKKEIADAYKKKVKIVNTVLSILFFIFPILALLIPYLLFHYMR